MYKYYSTQRPVMPGTFPKRGMAEFENYDSRKQVEEIGRPAWAELYYDRELSKEELRDYELVKAPENQ